MATSPPTSEQLAARLAFEAPEEVREALAAMGRTEDVRLSPSGSRLAFACYKRSQIAVAEVAIERGASGVEVEISGLVFHDSPSLRDPHGLDFVDDEHIVVANRAGAIELLRLPAPGDTVATSLGSIVGDLGAVGSVAVLRRSSGEHEVLAAHNWTDAVARYRIASDGSLAGGEAVLRHRLDLPDGLATSSDGRWLAVSNHNTHDVLVFETETLHAEVAPVGVLRGFAYPHGLRFGDGDRFLVVADAGAPYVDVFERAGESWATASYPATSLRVMDEDTFRRGHHNPREGGPKGLELDPRTNVLVVTAEELPVAFFDLELALELRALRPGADLVRNELERLDDLERSRAETAEARDVLRAVLATRAWRMTKPLRRLSGVLRRSGSA